MRYCFTGWWRRGPIIGLLLAVAMAMAGCSSIRLAYSNAPSLLTWWLDGYLDFDSAQSTRLRADLSTLHAWHRTEELPQLVAMLRDMQASAVGTFSADDTCRLSDAVQARLLSLTYRALPTAAAIATSLKPAQIDHLQATFDKRNQEWREEWLEGSSVERKQRRLSKLVDRMEDWYGTLSEEQVALLEQQIAASPFDPMRQFRETLRRQQDTLQTLRTVQQRAMDEAQAQAALSALVARNLKSPDAQFEAYTDTLRRAGCASIARFHASTTKSQRANLQQTLKSYETEATALLRP